MADMDVSHFSLMSLEDELTCSICLSPFDCPVTIPCGHNFCQECLLDTWKEDSYSCPQCRTHFDTKPELKKNTVLSTVVETFNSRTSKSETGLKEMSEESDESEEEEDEEEEEEEEEEDVIRCDTCMEAEASQTCLTCMASFCEEHLRPHRENPKFSVHQLIEPVGDLSERICPDHHKLMELFCSQHGRPICSLCLQQVHKGCSFISPEEQRNMKEIELRDKLGVLDGKMEKTEMVMFQINDLQMKLKDAATKKKTAYASVYQQMRDMLAQEEREAQHEVDGELEICQTKLRNFMKRLTENMDNMTKAREDVNSLLSESQTVAFLQASFDLPRVTKFEPHTPRINLDSKKVTAAQAFSAALKEHLTDLLKQPLDARLLKLKPDEKAVPVSAAASTGSTGSQPEFELPEPPPPPPVSHRPACPPMQTYYQPVPVPVYMGGGFQPSHAGWNPAHHPPGPYRGPRFTGGQKTNKKSDASHQPSQKKDRRPNPKPGGNNPDAKGPASTKKDSARSRPPSEKTTKHHPRPKTK
ncbi:E3 ubiquitin/ISG15 ligase TRIM25-like isoform X2 [Perca flavescens]|uniref:E3 ubiquitin/ISG15 ligase TRIM25-like isoform X2 n=1 Tax=Perca flavescens TaxID=8167 RepID=UPI00106E5D8B|nr:E3 ubiquitin/ISG15 ligase TRIM25-like isoform X2 [Perca flavescens]